MCALYIVQVNVPLNNEQLKYCHQKATVRSFVLSSHITLSRTAETVECCHIVKVTMGFLRIVVELQNIMNCSQQYKRTQTDLHVMCSIILYDCNKIWTFSIDCNKDIQ